MRPLTKRSRLSMLALLLGCTLPVGLRDNGTRMRLRSSLIITAPRREDSYDSTVCIPRRRPTPLRGAAVYAVAAAPDNATGTDSTAALGSGRGADPGVVPLPRCQATGALSATVAQAWGRESPRCRCTRTGDFSALCGTYPRLAVPDHRGGGPARGWHTLAYPL